VRANGEGLHRLSISADGFSRAFKGPRRWGILEPMERDGARPPAEQTPLWAHALEPLGRLYLWGSATRLNRRRRQAKRLPLPVVSVGNLTFGGTGKTPVTLALARFLREAGERPAVLLRGYGRRSKGPLRVLPSSSPEEVGEEALLYLRAIPDLPVVVSERREEGAALLLALGPTLFLLDDGFQHVETARDLDLLLVDTTGPRDLFPPPAGRLREPLSGASRADALFLSGGGRLPEALAPFAAHKPAFSVRFRWTEEPSLSVPPGLSWKALLGRPVVAFAGVGSPGRFLRDLKEAGLPPLRFLAFPDHAFPTEKRLAALERALGETRAEAVLTTEKDAVKWAPQWPFEVPLIWPRLEAILDDPGGLFPSLLQEALRRGRP